MTIEVVAPRGARAVIGDLLGDARVHELGANVDAGARLALEYVRRALIVTARKLPRVEVVVAASHFVPDAAALATFVRRGALGVAYVYHLVSGRPGFTARTLWSKADERVGLALLRRHASVVFVSNSRTGDLLSQRGFHPTHTAVGVDIASFPRVVPSELPPRAVFVARMARTKGVRDAIEAWTQVRESVPKARLVMVGTGPERDAGAALAGRIGIADAVDWPGFVSEQEKRRILGESRVLLAPSYEEGWGISVCEALASGVPVVAYRHPVLDELFDGAYLGAEPGDVSRLAELAVTVLHDDSLADALSARGRETAERYDVARVAETELEAILRACGS